MPRFTESQWETLQATYRDWWAGALRRPIVPVVTLKEGQARNRPPAPLLTQETCADFSFSPQQLIDRMDYELSLCRYPRDSFPYFNMWVFGPGVAAALLGARLDNRTGSVWFFPERKVPIQELTFSYDPDNRWLRRIKAIYREAVARWQGEVIIGMVDLGGVLDILATFLGSQELLLHLYDNPWHVKRLAGEITELWLRFYDEINDILRPCARGYSDWLGVYSEHPSYVLQSDFSYMISPEMFREFALGELDSTSQRLHRAFFHLDGVGMLRHLDDLLGLPGIHGIQWVQGDGKPGQDQWPEVYRKITAAGKRVHMNGGLDTLCAVIRQTGSAPLIHHAAITITPQEEYAVLKRLDSISSIAHLEP